MAEGSSPLNRNASETGLPEIERVLGQVRSRIRRFVVWQGTLQAAIWAGVAFWIALAMDRMPVEWGWSELTRGARLLVLVLIAGGAAWLLYRQVIRRLLVPLRSRSLALLLERRFPEMGDLLATAVSPHEQIDEARRQSLQAEALQRLERISLSHLLNYRRLTKLAAVAAVLAVSFVLPGILKPDLMSIGARRLLTLDSQTWPRRWQLESPALRVHGSLPPVEFIPEVAAVRPFTDSEICVAAGSGVTVLVRARVASSQPGDRDDLECRLYWKRSDGAQGVIPMNSVAGAPDGMRTFAAEGDALDAIDSDLEIRIRGGDASMGPLVIRAVPPPVLTGIEFQVEYPRYLADDQSSRWTPRTVPLSSGLRLPSGTRVTLTGQSTRPLDRAWLVDVADPADHRLLATTGAESADAGLVYDLGVLNSDLNLNIWLRDTTGVLSRFPVPVVAGVVEDQLPEVRFRLSGIGTAITSNARIPVTGTVTDDYRINSTWMAVNVPGSELVIPATVSGEGKLKGAVDLADLRREGTLAGDLAAGSGQQVSLTVFADDFNDMADDPRAGSGERYALDIVTPAELLRILERLETDQRRRLEQIHAELVESRDNIARSATGGSEPSGTTTGDEWQLRQLFAQRGLLQVQKSRQEIVTVAIAFEEIRGQLVNNRIDAAERRTRVDERIVAPLRQIADQSLAALETQLQTLDEQFRDAAAATAHDEVQRTTGEALAQADAVLVELQTVLGSLLKFETQNELLEVVRRLLAGEQDVAKRTTALRESEAFDDIFSSDEPAAPDTGSREAIVDDQSRLEEEYRLLEEKLFSLYQYEQDQNPDRARLLQNAYQQSRENLTLGHFQTASRMLREARWREAEKSQQTAVEHLQQLLDLLQSEDRDSGIRNEMARHREALREMDRILRIQQGLRTNLENNPGQSDDRDGELRDAAAQQDELARRAGELQRGMQEDASAEKAAENPGSGDRGAESNGQSAPPADDSTVPPGQQQNPLDKAIDNMRRAQQALEEARSRNAVEAMREAERELAKAREELEKTLRQLREEEIERSLASLESRFRKMLEVQLGIHDETRQLDDQAAGRRVPDLEIQSGRLATRQRELVQEGDRALLVLEDDGSSVATIETVRQLRLDFSQIADRLAAFQTGELTRQLQADAIETLGFLVEAFEQAQRDQEENDAEAKPQADQNAQPGQEALINRLAELKLIRGLQARILARHRIYAARLPSPDDPVGHHADADIIEALQQLGQRQIHLQEVTRDIVEQQRRAEPVSPQR